ncbi:structural maintenance of chromosomes protein 5 [Anopheles ziemanni]|uniref:structural maintenance of chromosomes protein 5 n=1 Tax=Anopheles coustani TaxID=139045 RepID=UPI002658145F|nr:structural maintenance of chromosomes protein 5 [Anopheles coustani]XP_058174979.1 structural maintenance of chromosomes protein 5 [Anopheles ziemanni]
MSQTVVGKIASVSLKNFVTYDSAVFYPDEYLNIILGPNGTGKSAIVAGIVLGMGGHCKLLSRCENIDSYIKNGKDSATIRISIYANQKRQVRWFSRSFDHNKSDTFEIDNVKVTARAYLEQIRKFNIQVDNLCQFLPQDRVQDFTKMNPCDLLVNTQASVCSAEMQQWFEELKTKRDTQLKSTSQRENEAGRIVELEARLADLQQQLESIRVRGEFEKQIDVCLARKAWLEYEELFLSYTSTMKDHNLAKKSFEEKERAYMRCKSDMAAILKRKEELEKALAQQLSIAQRSTEEINTLEEKSERLEDSIGKQKRDLQDALAKADERQTELDEAKVMLGAFVQDCADAAATLGSEEEVRQKIATLESQDVKIRNENELLMSRRQELNQKIDSDIKPEMMSIQRSIETIENVASMRLKILQTRFPGTYQAVMWLRDHTHLFRGKIYEPMILELNVPVAENVPFLENTIGVRDLIAFTCECTEDMNLFLKKIREEMRIEGVNVMQSDPADGLHYKPRHPISSMRRFGFHTYLIDTLEGPFPLLNGLCKLYGLHNIPIGGPESAKYITSLPDDIGIFFTPTNRFQLSKSRYSGEKSSRSDLLRPRNLLNRSTDHTLLAEKRQQLQRLVRECDKIRNHRGQIENQIKELQEKRAERMADIRALQEELSKYQQTKLKVRRQQQKCTELAQRLVNVDTEKAKFERSCRTIIEQLLEMQRRKIDALGRYATASIQNEVLQERLRIFQEENNEMESNYRLVEDAFQSAKRTLANVKKVFDRVKEKTNAKNIEARALTKNKAPDKPDFPFREEFATLPDTLEALESHLEELRVRFECLPEGNKAAAEEHAQKQRQVEQLKATMTHSAQTVASLECEMSILHEQWYPEMLRIVQNINTKFSHFMSTMGFAGEVELIRNEERDYNEYGIRIFVKYRNSEKLCALDRKLQSGGERAVAIAIYTLSLQHMTQVPFRCVDEINQGMDPTNERKVFNMLVDETCREGQSQYFFVTPKLLPRLRCNDKMNVVVVHNGKFIENPDVFLPSNRA